LNFPLYFRVDVLFTSEEVLVGGELELEDLERTIAEAGLEEEALLEALERGEAAVPFAGIVDTLLALVVG
jgi:hypothetical protein